MAKYILVILAIFGQLKLAQSSAESPLNWGLFADLNQYTNDRSDQSSIDSSQTVKRHSVAKITPYLNYQLSKNLSFSSQFAISHGGSEAHLGGSDQNGSVIVEEAYAKILTDKGYFSIGHKFIPVGLQNRGQISDVKYNRVQKPLIEQYLIPENWHENLYSYTHKFTPEFSVSLGAFDSLDANQLQSDQFLRGTNSSGQNAKSNNHLALLNLEAVVKEGLISGSFIYGDISQDSPVDDVYLTMGELHANFKWRYTEFKALWTTVSIENTEELAGLPIGSRAFGYYLELAHDLFFQQTRNDEELYLYFSYSEFNLDQSVPTGRVANKTLDQSITGIGVRYLPLINFSVKFEYLLIENAEVGEDAPDISSASINLYF